METRAWTKSGEKMCWMLVLTGDFLHWFKFKGNNPKGQMAQAAEAVLAGNDPSRLPGFERTETVRSIDRVVVSHGRDTVKFYKGVEAIDFGVGDNDPNEIARTVVQAAGLAGEERSEEVGVVEALTGPAILGVIAGVLWFFVFMLATADQRGEDEPRVRGRNAGLKLAFVWVANLLGEKGTIALGVLLAVFFIGWGVRRIVKRPQQLVWGAQLPG